MTLYPNGYGVERISLAQMKDRHAPRMHPEFARRLFAWIEAQGGRVGIGGGFRTVQPIKNGFAAPGKSFHQAQRFASGREMYAAVDLVHDNGPYVHRAPTWDEVPAQGSKDAEKWGVHCNVGVPGQIGSEPWHMQPTELDGYDRWIADGRPDPRPPAPPPTPDPEQEDDMELSDKQIAKIADAVATAVWSHELNVLHGGKATRGKAIQVLGWVKNKIDGMK